MQTLPLALLLLFRVGFAAWCDITCGYDPKMCCADHRDLCDKQGYNCDKQSCQGYSAFQNDTDLSGTLLDTKAGKPEDCCPFCDSNSACAGWSWFGDTCYIKGDLTGTYKNGGRVTSVKGPPGNCTGFSDALSDTDLAGTLIKQVFASLIDECCTACTAQTGCHGFVYNQQICYLKTNLTGTYSNPGSVTRCVGKCLGQSLQYEEIAV